MKHFALPLMVLLGMSSAFAAEVPVSRVILSSSGLAHFEHESKIEGSKNLSLPVQLNQVDDILKSLVVYDPAGSLGGVSLPGQQSLDQVFSELPFTRDQLFSPADLLNAYQGADVTISGPLNASGRLISVTPEQTITSDGRTVERHRITLMTAQGLRSAVLQDLSAINFTQESVRAEINRALQAVRDNASYDRRTLNIRLQGKGTRDVTLSYVVEAPLWKSAYRLVLPAEGEKASGLLQGWAVIENLSATDWESIDLSLVSGNPVTYRQALYQSYHLPRPELPLQIFERVMPRPDTGLLMSSAPPAPVTQSVAPRAALKAYAMADSAVPAFAAAAPEMARMDTVSNIAMQTLSAEASTHVLYRFPTRFDLKAGETMMVPFVSKKLPLESLYVYQPETHATHPLAAVRLHNEGSSSLPPGILTLYQEDKTLQGTNFVGDAQLPLIAPGEDRFVTYALDSKTAVRRDQRQQRQEGNVTFANGVMNVAVKSIIETDYTLKAPAGETRTVIIEHPRLNADYKITAPNMNSLQTTQNHYRLPVDLAKGESKTVTVVQERDDWNRISLSGLPTTELEAWAGSRGNLSTQTRKSFEQMASLRRAIDATDAELRSLDQKRKQIFDDQERIRENLKSLTGKSSVKNSYLKKLQEQEKEISKLDATREKLNQRRDEQMKRLQDYIANLSN